MHNMGGNVRLVLGPEQQSQLENWMEFQNYHLQRLEQFEKKQDKLTKELDDARKKAENTDITGSERAAEDAEAIKQVLKYAEWNLERHKDLLDWIEQERRTMDSGHSTPVEEDNDYRDPAPKAPGRASTRERRTRRAEASAVLGKARVMKAKSRKRDTEIQKPKAPEVQPAIQNLDVISQSSISQAPKRRETKHRSTKEEKPLRQCPPQSVSKTKRFADARTKSLAGRQPGGVGHTRSSDRARSKRRLATQRAQLARENVTTRIGRTSKPPVRWAPE